MAEVVVTFRVTMDSKKNHISVHLDNGITINFKNNNKIIYYYDTSQLLCGLSTESFDQECSFVSM